MVSFAATARTCSDQAKVPKGKRNRVAEADVGDVRPDGQDRVGSLIADVAGQLGADRIDAPHQEQVVMVQRGVLDIDQRLASGGRPWLGNV